ncbi:hypothetical protein EUTSA_v10010821mg [Eutrema salsugineum]|uniref:Dehydrin n=1 Tax=Eutrema salsugineum TaxID=72664 RepID=V4NGV1_EUTSA|nr:dehydrin Xero 1 [Eutrema salsugineum]ESQ45421.1 hypothetical protein EUTSA_v10010821mg [Eutrema salsugineum]
MESNYQNQSGAQQSHQQLDQYGNPVPVGTGVYAAPVMAGGLLHRSGSSSSSSSSSEDEGLGGRRKKKGITEKIKEKLPCGHHGSHQTSSAIGNTTAYDTTGTGAVHHEKKGIVEKIMDKLPGGHY